MLYPFAELTNYKIIVILWIFIIVPVIIIYREIPQLVQSIELQLIIHSIKHTLNLTWNISLLKSLSINIYVFLAGNHFQSHLFSSFD